MTDYTTYKYRVVEHGIYCFVIEYKYSECQGWVEYGDRSFQTLDDAVAVIKRWKSSGTKKVVWED